MAYIDLRSDTVTKPTPEMLGAILDARVGDDVYGEDPTVNELEEYVAELLGKEKALFVPTGVMSNQLCLKALTNPGDEVILGSFSHIFNYETAAPALLSGIQVYTSPDPEGYMELEDIGGAIREEAYYLPRTAVVAQEQTHNRAGGRVIPMDQLHTVAAFATERGIANHLDGARLWNACAASGVLPKEYAAPFDTVSVCLSKGLGAPIGSVLVGSAHHVKIAHKFRKVWGGGWRQAGILAAAGLHALKHHQELLQRDHANARIFDTMLHEAERIEVLGNTETNMVLFRVPGTDPHVVSARAKEQGVLISTAFKGKLRAVFHMDVSEEETVRAAEILKNISVM